MRIEIFVAGAAALTLITGATQADYVTAADESLPAGIQIVHTDEGPVFADASGKTLYTWSGDSHPGKSLCNNEHYTRVDGQGQIKLHVADSDTRPTCAQVWPAAIAQDDPVGKWGVITRDDGAKQWTYGGKPLYTTILDKESGDVFGEDLSVFGARKPLAAPTALPPGVSIAMTSTGRTLTNADGWTLYSYDRDPLGKSACEGACAETWIPVHAPELAPSKGEWTAVQRADGVKQWAFRGKPLYTYANEERRRDFAGQDVPRWKAAVVQPAAERPSDIKVNVTSAGDVFADHRGMTLYTFRCIEEAPDGLSCDTAGSSPIYRLTICGGAEKCIAMWRPLPAASNARSPNKIWSVVEVDPRTGGREPGLKKGLRVWAYKGRPVYTYAGDQRPGDYKGHHMRVFPTRGFSMMLTSNER